MVILQRVMFHVFKLVKIMFLHDPDMPKRLVSALLMKKASDYKMHIKWIRWFIISPAVKISRFFTKSTSSKQRNFCRDRNMNQLSQVKRKCSEPANIKIRKTWAKLGR